MVGADALREGGDGVADALQDVGAFDAGDGEGAGSEFGEEAVEDAGGDGAEAVD
ncbi:MAG: hypothetical protein NT167_23975 [Verrucomicrobia bacterium]|nr:hypothetical protein [Verrucomicrobiota bacterium]